MSKSGLDAMMDGITTVLKTVPKEWKSGEMPCPVCKTGTIKWVRVAFNNHLRMGCTTPACIMMMQ